MKIYDCMMFSHENDLLEIRVNQHWDFVDKFIVVEAGETHTGLKKDLNFDHARFEQFKDKIIYRSFDSFDQAMLEHPELLDDYARQDRGPNKHSADWTRDHFQLNYIMHVLAEDGAEDDDICYIACADEILKREAMAQCVQFLAANPDQDPMFMFQYWLYAWKFNMLHKDCNTSDSSGGLSRYRLFKRVLPATLRDQRACSHLVGNAGWHFTFMDPTDGEMILRKQRSWAHSRDTTDGKKKKFDNMTKEEALSRFLEDYALTRVNMTYESHPKFIMDNLEKFKDYIYNE